MNKYITTFAVFSALVIGAAVLCACGKKTTVYAPKTSTTVVRPATHSSPVSHRPVSRSNTYRR